MRGVKTNIAFIANILTNPVFQAGKCYTKFIDETPELFDISESRNRANKLLEYIGNLVVNDPVAGAKMYEPARVPNVEGEIPRRLQAVSGSERPRGPVQAGDERKAPADLRHHHARRPSVSAGHPGAHPRYDARPPTVRPRSSAAASPWKCGAAPPSTWPTAFLHESPWERLDVLRKAIPNIPFQMLLRGANAVGYTNYPRQRHPRIRASGGPG